ncbi:peptide/nickel transport system permease protein [Labrenzia sp. EL_208]|uniref:ABC transporter permease n=1 Tax=Roseibium album TaxID=311410 RepID=UPI000CF03306|nr:peptide/nickel transport system permease protein [Labrenzia sp. EL_142]MBG6165740.1 peptide/nickel transport system permease protein [Labrenzia sp. EL_195]MBG6176614.1 peptide/nickel transport system permease protein [Labrenzia sp. EL_132]MBG6202000.1 peptide/nickel transport system permease protein [Labrenzia sp. EL_13]MBG6210229.1 peptide/nickel transport system permease protein [Labrenzia sp. EL_126]MBG6230916.1 peptide/nickel transport system permease protein [Labrenzia sp. EL_208]
MTVFVIRRLMQAFLVVFLMSVIVFFGVNIVGDPVYMLVSPDADQADIEAAIRRLGLDRPIWEQYFLFLKGAAQGNLGDSFVFGQPALKLILHHMPATLELAFSALFLAIVFGIPLGLFSGLYPDNPVSKGIMAGSILGFSLPTFWVGLMLILLFAVELGWLPSTGRGDTGTVFGIQTSLATWDGIRHIFLPALNLSLLKISLAIRLTRAGVREAMGQDYVKYARAKGVSTKRIIFVHVMKNIMIPVVTVMGLEFGSLIGFSVVTETIFAWPGMGKLLIDAILQLDRPVVVAYLMIMVLFFVLINLVVDILYSILDPRVRLQDQGA